MRAVSDETCRKSKDAVIPMNPKQISEQLPNGFHGALIERVSVDYIGKNLEFVLTLLVPDESNLSGHSRLRRGRLQVEGLGYLTLNMPDPHSDYTRSGGFEIRGLLDTTPKICPSLPVFQAELGPGFFFHSFFVEEWNGFIHFAGTQATFEWLEE